MKYVIYFATQQGCKWVWHGIAYMHSLSLTCYCIDVIPTGRVICKNVTTTIASFYWIVSEVQTSMYKRCNLYTNVCKYVQIWWAVIEVTECHQLSSTLPLQCSTLPLQYLTLPLQCSTLLDNCSQCPTPDDRTPTQLAIGCHNLP